MVEHSEWVDKWWTDNDILSALETPSEWNWSDAKGLIIARHLWVQLQAERARVKELEAALRFYADPQTYGIHGGNSQRIFQDAGGHARETLRHALNAITESDTPSGRG